MRNANKLRERILPNNRISVRKTFGLNVPGCSVNCNYCSLGKKYVGYSNKNRIVDGIERRISQFQKNFPINNIELVGYWYGISDHYNTEFQRLASLIRNINESVNNPVIGGDLGVILNPEIFSYLKEAGLTYLHNNLETSKRLYSIAIGKDRSRLDKKIETLRLAYRSGLKITSGLLIGLGETIDDLIEQITMLRSLPLTRIVVNFMDYDSNREIGKKFAHVRNQLTPEYALHILIFLRKYIRPDQSLMVGSGVRRYLYDEQALKTLLNVVDTLHLGSFINLRENTKIQNLSEEECDLKSANKLINKVEKLGYNIISPPYFKEMF